MAEISSAFGVAGDMFGRDAVSIHRPTSSATSSKRDSAEVETKLTDKQLVPEVLTTQIVRKIAHTPHNQ